MPKNNGRFINADVTVIEVLATNASKVEKKPGILLTIRPDPKSFAFKDVFLSKENAERLMNDIKALFDTSPTLNDGNPPIVIPPDPSTPKKRRRKK